jgi:hypothetical protein
MPEAERDQGTRHSSQEASVSEVLDALELWALISLLAGWIFARAAWGLRQGPTIAFEELEPDPLTRRSLRSQQPARTPLLELVQVFDEDLRAVMSAGSPPSHV